MPVPDIIIYSQYDKGVAVQIIHDYHTYLLNNRILQFSLKVIGDYNMETEQ